jgi:Fe(3+) dicitrate transport protein
LTLSARDAYENYSQKRGNTLASIRILGASALAIAAGLSPAAAQESAADGVEIAALADIVIVGSREEAAEVGGSVQYLDRQTLETFSYGDVNHTLRQASGVYLQEEEGFGLRPNIGIRGSGTDRNSRITVMEDGILIAPAPYAAPAAYYFPRIARITGVEISKGPAAIVYGPMTVGGALNLFSTPIPENGLDARLDLFGGEYGALRAHGSVGGWTNIGGAEIGGLIEALRESSDGFKELDSGGDTGFEIDDVVARIGVRATPGAAIPQSLEFKYQHSDETSDETYLGLTLADFEADPYRRYRGSQVDEMNVEHSTYQLTHRIEISPAVDLTTVVYRTETERTWYKLNDVRNSANTGWVGIGAVLEDPATYADQMAILIGEPGFVSSISAAGDLRVRNNHREYYAQGVQSVLALEFDTGSASHDLQLSARYHADEEDRFQHDDRYHMVDSEMVLVTPGAPGSQDNRVGEAEAWAFFARDTIAWGDWRITPGLRYETIELTQTNYGGADPNRIGPGAVSSRDVDIWIPGVGVTYDLNERWRLLAGAHRGFASPAPGSSVDPETSWNYEAGARFEEGDLRLEAIAFFNDYDNLVGTCTASTGGGCAIGAQFDGGEVEVKGAEVTAAYDAGAAFGWGVEIPLSLVYTFTEAEFGSSFNSSYGPWGDVNAGDELPYLPNHQLTLNAGVVSARWRANVALNYVSEARGEAGQGPIPANERVDERVLVDVAGEFRLTDNVALFGTVSNLTDEVYNVGFSPAGARPGAPRIAMGGLRVAY